MREVANLTERKNPHAPPSERDSLTVRALACHAADPGSNPAGGNDFFNRARAKGPISNILTQYLSGLTWDQNEILKIEVCRFG